MGQNFVLESLLVHLVMVSGLDPSWDREALFKQSRESKPRIPRHLLLNKGVGDKVSAAGLFQSIDLLDLSQTPGSDLFLL